MDLVAEAADAAPGRPAHPHVPRSEPGVPGLVRAGTRAGADRQVAHGPGGRDARLVARGRVPDRGAVLDDAGDRARGAAGGRGGRRAVDTVRGGGLEAAQAAGDLAPGARRPGGGAELLAARRVAAVLAGAGRAVGGVRRQPVAASGGAGAGRGGRGVADQLRAGHGQRSDRACAGIPAPRDTRRETQRGPRRARRGRRGGSASAPGRWRTRSPRPARWRARRRSPWCSRES